MQLSAFVHFFKKKMTLVFNVIFKLSRPVWLLSATEVQSSSLSPSVSFICPCVTVQLQHASQFLWELSLGFQCVGEDFCLAPHLSVTYLNHAHSCCPSHCLPIFLSLSAVTHSKISLILLCLASLPPACTKGHFSVCHTQGIKAFVSLILPKSENESWLLS